MTSGTETLLHDIRSFLGIPVIFLVFLKINFPFRSICELEFSVSICSGQCTVQKTWLFWYPNSAQKPESCYSNPSLILSILTIEIKDDGFGQSLRAVIVVARTCKFSVAMLSVETFNFHGISRLSRDNFFETTIDQLTILPPADTASWTSFEKKKTKK